MPERMSTEVADGGDAVNRPSLTRLFLSFLRLGLTAFGGPAMVAYIGNMAVKRRKWLSQQSFKDGVALCQSIPGATAMQSAAYVGLRARGVAGALTAFVGFGLPAFVLMTVLSALYGPARSLSWVAALFAGLQVIVVALVANATYSFGRGALKGYRQIIIAVVSATLLWLKVSPFLVIVAAGLAGILVMKPRGVPAETSDARENSSPIAVSHVFTLFLVVAVALVLLYLMDRGLWQLSFLMLKIDLFAFGGGFASLPLMLREVVSVHKWMDHKTFMDGIALGQVTPGPIVITSAFVGYLVHGLSGAVVATLSIFTPSFLALVVGTIFIDRLKGSRYFQKAVGGILASFVGLLLYVTITFALAVPWDILRVLVCVASFVALLKKIDTLWIIGIGAALSIVVFR
jgi:chromate transporter